ncbi:uncharacterized protein LOC131181632 [Hevea brasiliensis]|uniref:uncharacterized protein LOC131181632 n=1 Tax=Hevea brasiliensis TaxID=3981 RepID=UPI0025CCC75F|nr:uncharacterized protein LOC131181632 [Hevea brasiliensis]
MEEAAIVVDRAAAKEMNRNLISMNDPLNLQSSDHPGMVLAIAPLVGSNFRSCYRAMKIALGEKQKLGFVDGTINVLAEGIEAFEQWKRCDYVVTSRILNSISKNIAEDFIYTTSSKEMWDEISERFGESNRPMIYQLQRKVSSVSQENIQLHLTSQSQKRLWDELDSIDVLPPFTCGVSKEIAESTNRNRLMQFLMGLNDVLEPTRNQILLMDPLCHALPLCKA